jgi:hypothetical protein
VSNPLSGLSATETVKIVAGGLLPLLGALIASGIAWAKDLNRDARRLRSLEEMTRRIEFWDKWRTSLESTNALTDDRREIAIAKIVEAGEVTSNISIPKRHSQSLLMRIVWPSVDSGQFESRTQGMFYKAMVIAAILAAGVWAFGPKMFHISPKYGVLQHPKGWLVLWVTWAVLLRAIAYFFTQYANDYLEKLNAKMTNVSSADSPNN